MPCGGTYAGGREVMLSCWYQSSYDSCIRSEQAGAARQAGTGVAETQHHTLNETQTNDELSPHPREEHTGGNQEQRIREPGSQRRVHRAGGAGSRG